MAEKSTPVPVKKSQPEAALPASTDLWQPFTQLRHEIDRLFDDFWGGSRRGMMPRLFDFEPLAKGFKGAVGFVQPKVDVAETDMNYEITAELPGLDEKDVDVSLSDGVLTIRGEKKTEAEEKKKDYYRVERSYGSFQRSFALPDSINEDKITATFEKGVLKLTLPKTAEAQKKQRKIEIKAGK
ncbi:MAG: Hsp20/alpha crystallin family protein [Alphaproteobacteria bacterium]